VLSQSKNLVGVLTLDSIPEPTVAREAKEQV
jgi:hypothetical protein